MIIVRCSRPSNEAFGSMLPFLHRLHNQPRWCSVVHSKFWSIRKKNEIVWIFEKLVMTNRYANMLCVALRIFLFSFNLVKTNWTSCLLWTGLRWAWKTLFRSSNGSPLKIGGVTWAVAIGIGWFSSWSICFSVATEEKWNKIESNGSVDFLRVSGFCVCPTKSRRTSAHRKTIDLPTLFLEKSFSQLNVHSISSRFTDKSPQEYLSAFDVLHLSAMVLWKIKMILFGLVLQHLSTEYCKLETRSLDIRQQR